MKTKKFIPILTTFILSIGVLSCHSKKNKTNELNTRPNIVFIMSDDHASQAITAYGGIYDSLAPTPNIDKIAEEGMIMKNVFCTNAICGPSRASILTGKYSHVNGYFKNENGGQFNPDQWTFPEELQKNGYQTALFGKWHLGSEPKGFDYYKYHAGAGQQGFYWNPVYNENGKIITEKGYATNLTTDFALDWLENTTNSKVPFCILLQYKAPHRNWEPDTKYINLWEDIEMPYPETYNDNYKGREKTAGDTDMTIDFFNRKDMKLTPSKKLKGKELAKWLQYGNKRGENVYPNKSLSLKENRNWKYQTYIKDYLACIKSVDDNVGRILKFLEEKGLSDNTIVIYTSDQGFFLGEHGWFDKRFMYEEALRMPFLIKYPKLIKQKSINSDIITNIDFAPTLIDAAGIKIPEEVQGKSFLKNLQGKTPQYWQKSMYYHYYEFPFWHHVQPHYGIRNKQYKLIHFYYNIDQWEFYNLEKDPNELNNLINDEHYSGTINKMKNELNRLQKYYKNNLTIEELRGITDKNFGNIIHKK